MPAIRLPPYFDTAAQHPLLDDNADMLGSNSLSSSAGSDGAVALGIKLGTGLDSDVNSAEAPATIIELNGASLAARNASSAIFLPDGTNNAVLSLRANNNNVDVAAAIIEVRRPSTTLESGIVDDGFGNPVTDQRVADDYVRRLLIAPGLGGCPATEFCLDFGAGATGGDLDQFDAPGTYELYGYVEDSDTGDLSPQERAVIYKALAGNLPPAAPVLVAPLDAAINVPLTVFLNWDQVVDPEFNPVSYTVRIATDAAMTNVVYLEEGLQYSAHPVPPGSGLLNSTPYYWDVQAIDSFGASVDPVGPAWLPSSPFSFTTVGSTNNNTGVINGLIYANAGLAQLNNLSVARTNPGGGETPIINIDGNDLSDPPDGIDDFFVYSVDTIAGSVNLLANADGYQSQIKVGIQLGAQEELFNENFALQAISTDADSDGIDDAIEGANEIPPTDSDSDGTPDYQDLDSDNNGLLDPAEVGNAASPTDTDSDGTPDFQDFDNDNDGIDDIVELGNAGIALDLDNDGIPDFNDADSQGVGDINADRKRDVGDLIWLQRHLADPVNNPLTLNEQQQADIAPLGGDGSIDIADLLELQHALMP